MGWFTFDTITLIMAGINVVPVLLQGGNLIWGNPRMVQIQGQEKRGIGQMVAKTEQAGIEEEKMISANVKKDSIVKSIN